MDIGEYIWKFIEVCQSFYDLQEHPLCTPLKWQSLLMRKYAESKNELSMANEKITYWIGENTWKWYDKGLISRIYKWLTQLNTTKKQLD